MSKKTRSSSMEKKADKKSAVINSQKRDHLLRRTLLFIAALVAGGLIFHLLQGGFENTPGSSAIQPEVTASEVIFPVQGFQDGKARYFQYPTGNGITVRFFVIRSSDGVVRAAFDSCDVCWREGKGYYQEGDFMVCRNCGQRFASVKVNEVKGGCNPVPLNRTIVGDKLVLKVADILKGSRYFNFGRVGYDS